MTPVPIQPMRVLAGSNLVNGMMILINPTNIAPAYPSGAASQRQTIMKE
jgi:hypothetical protein